MSAKKFQAICFDWGGVISVYSVGNYTQEGASRLGIPAEEFGRAYYRHNDILNKGKERVEEAVEMWKTVLGELGKLDMLESFLAFLKSRPPGKIDQDILALIHNLKAAGYKLGLLSNASLDAAADIRMLIPASLFDATLFSAEIGFIKPEPQSFNSLADALGVPLDEMIFIDDSRQSLITAPELGYEPILYKGYGDLVAQLKRLGIAVTSPT